MQFDPSASLAIFDLKRKRLDALAAAGDHHRWCDGLVRLVRWVLGEPMLRAYVTQIVAGYEAEEAEIMRKLRDAPAQLSAAAAKFRAECTSPSESSGWPAPLDWARFDASLAAASQPNCTPTLFRGEVGVAAIGRFSSIPSLSTSGRLLTAGESNRVRRRSPSKRSGMGWRSERGADSAARVAVVLNASEVPRESVAFRGQERSSGVTERRQLCG